MSRRFKIAPVRPAATLPDTQPQTGAMFIERLLVGALTALIAARMLVAGDDPGRLRLTAGAGPLTLNALTFLLLLIWAVWRGWTRRNLTFGPAGLVVGGLLIVAGFVFLSAGSNDRYQRPGWFIAWDWAALGTLCFLIWQLASNSATSRGLIAVLLATAVSLAAQALYDEAARSLRLPTTEIVAGRQEQPLAGDDEFRLSLEPPALSPELFRATFGGPDVFAGFLILLLPSALVWATANRRNGRRIRLTILVPLTLAAALFFAASSWWPKAALPGSGWGSAEGLIERFPWLGVGPGNFSRHVAFHPANPGSFWLGLAATTGLLAAVALLLTWVGVLVAGIQRVVVVTETEIVAPSPAARWEYYHGGIVGLLLGMILATGDIPAEADASETLRLGVTAGGRAFIWFAVFALLENGSVNLRSLRCSLLLGVFLTAVLGIVSDGLSSPLLQQPFWLAATLALACGTTRGAASASLPRAWIALPFVAALLAANLAQAYVPGVATASAVRSARSASKVFPHAHAKTVGPADLDHITFVRDAKRFVSGLILQPLNRALELDPENSQLQIELARWYRWQWRYSQELRDAEGAKYVGARALQLTERADQIDSRNLAGKLSQFETLLLFARPPSKPGPAQITALDKVITQIAQREPKLEAQLRYRVVLTLLDNRDQDQKLKEAIDSWAVTLLKLDREQDSPRGDLAVAERSRLIRRIKEVIQWPSQELAELTIGE